MSETVDIEAIIRKVTEAVAVELRKAFAQEFERGRQAAIQKIMSAAQEPIEREAPEPEEKPLRNGTPRRVRLAVDDSRSHDQVPRGLPAMFVRRVLSEHPKGIAPGEITQHGKTSMERKISYSAIRKALWK